ncbi:MAG TPA: helicase C-terminal domain-containing protein [Candidatus Hydrogenedentes bacterium]|nr:helicase C-terminal domain-containing protein [Candidatus Hydrogenedentota bacterium]
MAFNPKGAMALPGEPADHRISPEIQAFIRDAVRAADGAEVFIAGTPDASGTIVEARVLARGNQGAVPAVFEGLRAREVLIHNHPGGDLRPSEADLLLSARFAGDGHGSFIVDNDVTRVYVVVEPFLPEPIRPVEVDEITALLAGDGPVARVLGAYEHRPQQIEMAAAVARAFNEERVAVIEAPTGVGKTLAYLVPAILWTVRNRERVVVSTRTITLQEQLMHKDIPLLRQALPDYPFEACLVKGRGNYLCRRKLARALEESTLFDDATMREQFSAIAEWASVTQDGSLSDLPFEPARAVWDRVNSEADTCQGSACPALQQCFVAKARRAMARADILVVNHHLFFADLAIRKERDIYNEAAVLPSFRRVIFDEAHGIEDSATEYLGDSCSWGAVEQTLRRLRHGEGGKTRGLLPLLELKLLRDCAGLDVDTYVVLTDLINQRITPACDAVTVSTREAFLALKQLAESRVEEGPREVKWRITPAETAREEVRQVGAGIVLPAVESVARLARELDHLIEGLKQVPPNHPGEEPPLLGEVLELTALAERLRGTGLILAAMLAEEHADNEVRWVETDRGSDRFIRLFRCPLEVAGHLSEGVYDRMRAVVMTSATLTVSRDFGFFSRRVGVDRVAASRLDQMMLTSPFDFRAQALLAIPTDGPEPDRQEFSAWLSDALLQIFEVTRGHALVLFTSFQSLRRAFRDLEQPLRHMGINPLWQGGAPRGKLLDTFRRDRSSVLFATDSFWEGIDVSGDALTCVILTKLPFRVPTEPVQEARCEAIERKGGNAFMDYSLPQAAIKLRQGFGRLIRNRADWGSVVILDRRVVTRRYGGVFLKSLPEVTLSKAPLREMLEELRIFFNRHRSTDSHE